MAVGEGFPELWQVALDCTDARALAEFYRQLLGRSTAWGTIRRRPASPTPTGRAGWC